MLFIVLVLNIVLAYFLIKLEPKIDAVLEKAPELVKSANKLLGSVNVDKLSSTLDTIHKLNETVCVKNKGIAWPGYKKSILGVDFDIPEIKIC